MTIKISEFIEVELDEQGMVSLWEVVDGQYLKCFSFDADQAAAVTQALSILKDVHAKRSYESEAV